MKANRLTVETERRTKGGSLPKSSDISAAHSSSPTGQKNILGRLDRDQQRRARNSHPKPAEVTAMLKKIILELYASDAVAQASTSPAATSDAADLQTDGAIASTPPAAPTRDAQRDHACVEKSAPRPRIVLWKRLLDLIGIGITLPIWLPLIILTMAWIAIVSRGPVFYRQQRVGLKRCPFMIFKFRTMHVNSETGSHERHFERLVQSGLPMAKLDSIGDPRLIRMGRALRAAGLDELPQLFNIIRGEMSLVGPRPCTLLEFPAYKNGEHERFDAPPGLTGYWQANGKNRTTFSEMIAMDIFYARHMSLRLDLAILARTVPAVLSQIVGLRGSALARQRSETAVHN